MVNKMETAISELSKTWSKDITNEQNQKLNNWNQIAYEGRRITGKRGTAVKITRARHVKGVLQSMLGRLQNETHKAK